jgi:hypothetical protein
MAYYSLTLSSSMAYESETYKDYNFLTTFYNDSSEKVEATYTKAKMGFYPPILFNSAITVKGLVLG